MFHYIQGQLQSTGSYKYIINDTRGIQVLYLGTQKKGDFRIYPHMDDNKKTITYFAFDTAEQKHHFEQTLKINGIGPKTAFQIVQLPYEGLENAIKNLDVRFFQSIPGIGPKTAKKILLELKDSFELEDVQKIDIDEKLYKNITSSLKNLGYESNKIKTILQKYDGKITEKNMGEVIKRVISEV